MRRSRDSPPAAPRLLASLTTGRRPRPAARRRCRAPFVRRPSGFRSGSGDGSGHPGPRRESLGRARTRPVRATARHGTARRQSRSGPRRHPGEARHTPGPTGPATRPGGQRSGRGPESTPGRTRRTPGPTRPTLQPDAAPSGANPVDTPVQTPRIPVQPASSGGLSPVRPSHAVRAGVPVRPSRPVPAGVPVRPSRPVPAGVPVRPSRPVPVPVHPSSSLYALRTRPRAPLPPFLTPLSPDRSNPARHFEDI